MMSSTVSQDKWDYGWLHGGFANCGATPTGLSRWFGGSAAMWWRGSSPPSGDSGYFGPPLSFTYQMAPYLLAILSIFAAGSCG
jgi:hypothetical protein